MPFDNASAAIAEPVSSEYLVREYKKGRLVSVSELADARRELSDLQAKYDELKAGYDRLYSKTLADERSFRDYVVAKNAEAEEGNRKIALLEGLLREFCSTVGVDAKDPRVAAIVMRVRSACNSTKNRRARH